MADLKARVLTLEREQRFWKRAAVAVLFVLLGALLAGGALAPKSMDALSVRSLSVRDDSGAPRWTIEGGTGKDGGPKVLLLDPDRRVRASWTTSGLSVTGADGGAAELKSGSTASIAVSRDGHVIYEINSKGASPVLSP
ncbi:MAG TPA: hypothetical protein VG389_19940 [Myxococcota bacterium]|jgi:hypothetical protein|nr:hypothetical protein [Myxococcota bacterium]